MSGSPAAHLMPLMGAAPLLHSDLALVPLLTTPTRLPRRIRLPLDRTDGATITVLYIRENCVISPAIWRKLTPTPKWPVSDVVAKNVALTPPVKVRGVKESGSPDWEIGTSVGPTGCSAAAVLFI